MALTDKQAIMVIHQEGITTSALASQASSAHPLYVVLKPLHPGGRSEDERAQLTNNTSPLGGSTLGFQKVSSMHLAAMASTNSSNQLWNLPAESTCRGITVTLDNNNMWNEFYRCQTEMILTKQGRRMFPCCRFRISGLEPFQRYTLVMDMHPVDNYRYKWSDRRWETNGKADPHIERSFVHPESPMTGLDWMQNPVSFYKLKLTNNPLDQEGHIIINSMHRYLPRLHIIPADKATDAIQLNGPDVTTFSFPQTEFFAVTAYQNLCITQLKIDYNPFAKGFRDDSNNSRSYKPKNGLPTETVESDVKPSRETTTLNNLKTLFAKRNAAEKVVKGQALPVPTDEDFKSVNGDVAITAELEKSSSKKRPWPEGLSELIKGAHVKVKRISLEKIQSGDDQQMNTCSLPADEEKTEPASKDSKMENISITAVDQEEMEAKHKPKQESATADVKNVSEAEGLVIASTVSLTQATESFTKKYTPNPCLETTNIKMNPNNGLTDASINEKEDTSLSDTATITDGREISHCLVKPLDCGEVKKKRAEPVPLPLLALFLQQLKSKTRPTRLKSKCETSSLPGHVDKSCKSSVAEKVFPSTACFSPSLITQPEVSRTSETVTTSILTCATTTTTASPCLPLSPATSSDTSFTTSPTLPGMPTSLRLSPFLITDPDQVPNAIHIEQKATPTLESKYDTNIVPAPTTNISDTALISKQEDATVTLSVLGDNAVLDAASDTNVSDISCDAFCALSPSSSKLFPAALTDGPQNEVVCSNVITTESTADPILDSCKDPCPEFVPEAPYQSPLSDDDIDDVDDGDVDDSDVDDGDDVDDDVDDGDVDDGDVDDGGDGADGADGDADDADDADAHFSPSVAEFSPPSSPPSSPDPFPPGLFSDRPIPPRKYLDPFPSCVFDRPRPVVDTLNPLPRSIFITKPTSCPRDSETRTQSISPEVTCSTVTPDPCISQETNQVLQDTESKMLNLKHKKSGQLKLADDAEASEGPIPVPMQPNLEDVEGQLFVSFMSKKALEIHLGEEAKEETLQKTTENIDDVDSPNIEERIDELEKVLLRDLKIMKHRQVIHPVLQAVGLKLNLLDLTLAIDLQYLGVCLPIPPPVLLPGSSSESSASSQVPFISRTGKTTDFTKIKGWRDKFATSSSSVLPGVGTTPDGGQKNLSAFCSDMLDEYLESEGKLIDERAASFSQAVATPVAYQLPTKSTSYVRTLDSVLKKQAPPFTASTLKPFSACRKFTLASKNKEIDKLGENTTKKSKAGAAKNLSKKSTMVGSSKLESVEPSLFSLSPTNKSKMKTKKGSRTLKASLLPDGKPTVSSVSGTTVGQDSNSNTPGSVAAGRIPGLSKILVKLMDVEDGAVWEGKYRTCISEERATIALSALVTAEATVKGSASTVIKRRAPPCLNDFCRLGCICSSLAQERRQHHCGKPQCMLGCDCLRRKVVVLKNLIGDEGMETEPLPQGEPDENGTEVKKKKKKKKAYVLSGPEATPEPARSVKRLWDKKDESDSECLFIPTPSKSHQALLLSPELQQDLDNFLHPLPNKNVSGGGLSKIKDNNESLACARARPFCRKNPSSTEQGTKQGDPHLTLQGSTEEIEEGELRPPALSGPTKRLEIVSKCKWETEGSRNVVLRVVCERMAQDRLKSPFWVGKYQIHPISKTVHETDEESMITYKVSISQPHIVKNEPKEEETEKIKKLEAQLIKTIGKSEVKGLPLLSQVTPAGLLKAEKKPSGVPGHITVNGKPYPQAKLELGQMGALHPANRLAAYITGRVCLDNQHASKTVTRATISTTAPVAPATTTTAVATPTSVTSTCSSAVISVKPIVTKPPGGTVFTQVVINHMNSRQEKLFSASASQLPSTIKNIVHSSSSLMAGAAGGSVSSDKPAKASMAPQAPAASHPPDGPHLVVKTLPVSGSTSPVKRTIVVRPHAAVPGGGVKMMQPVISAQPQVPGQKMVFQILKTANGGTMYRSPNGQLIQLVPFSQFKALNPTVLIPKQTSVVRLPSTTASTPQDGSSFSVTPSTPATSTTSVLQAGNAVPVHSITTSSMATLPISSVAEKTVSSLNSMSQPSTVKIVPGKTSIKIVSPTVLTCKDSRITVTIPAPSTQSTSNVAPTNGGFIRITPPSTLTIPKLDLSKSESSVKVSSVSTERSEQDEQTSSGSEKPSERVVLQDHCYTFEAKRTKILRKMSENEPGDAASPTSAPDSNMQDLSKEMLEFGPIEEDEESDVEDAALGPEFGGESMAGLDVEEVYIHSDSTELTEDSDMYDDSDLSSDESTDDDVLYIDSKTTNSDSERGEKNKNHRDIEDVKMPNLRERDDDDLVDIETFEEKDEKDIMSHVSNHKERSNQNLHVEEDRKFLHKKKREEMKRRTTMKECFHKMRMTLNQKDNKSSKIMILRMAQEEILSLKKERDQLVKMENKLKEKRAYYLQQASKISGKTEKSISRKLVEIITKQKSLQEKDGCLRSSALAPPVPKPTPVDLSTRRKKLDPTDKVKDILNRNAQLSPNSKPIDLSINKVPEACDKEKESVRKSSQPAKPLILKTPSVSKATPYLQPAQSRGRTRPNILSRCKPRAKEQEFLPQVIPLMEVLPCNPVINLRNPLQPIGITSLSEGQSATPGVAAVSISVPTMSHAMHVENQVPVLQPQVLTLGKIPLKNNSPVKAVNLPKISSVVSLVPSEKLLLTPSVVLQKTDGPPVNQTQAACNPECVEGQQNPLLISSNAVAHVGEGQGLDKQLLEVVPKEPVQGARVNIVDTTSSQTDEGKIPASEAEVENLMSLLDELVFLNQQLNDEQSQSQEDDLNVTETNDGPTSPPIEKEAGVDRDDERSLSPLFLKLDEDLITTTSKDEMEDIPPKVDDLVKVIFGSDSPNLSESEAAAGANEDGTSVLPCRIKSDAPSPPPLLQMKVGGGTTGNSLKEQVSVSWRPMPKLAPLGLKTQEAGQLKATSPHVLKPDSKPPSLRSAHL